MTQHARKPAALALLLTLALGIGALGAAGKLAPEKSSSDLRTLERQIAGHPDAATWNAYGDALRAVNRNAYAADAYRRTLALDPSLRTAKINLALSLAAARDADGFFAYVGHLTMTDPKLTADLLDKAELIPLHADARFAAAQTNAHAAAVD